MQRRLSEFARLLVYAALAVCALVFALGLMRGNDFMEMLLTTVSLAVAAIPEGLPAVVTIVLALGVQRMAGQNALVRKLPSVETLGSATVIASDKTGTLTENQMTVQRLYLPPGAPPDAPSGASDNRTVRVTGAGYAPEGEFFIDDKRVSIAEGAGLPLTTETAQKPLKQAIEVGLMASTAAVAKEKESGQWRVTGDPTEGALVTLALKAGVEKAALLKRLHFVTEVPFDSARKMMTTVFIERETGTETDSEREEPIHHVYVKGAIERVLELCTHTLAPDGTLAPFGKEGREAAAVETAKRAGILPLMITGDHKSTAIAIAREIGAFTNSDIAITGAELDRMDGPEFVGKLERIKVYARVNPEHKLRVVRAWRERGDIIAMTGDGVNDAPALKEADIGIAMGITGTDVTKEAADMVLLDDNFSTIISAVEQGRGIFDNIRRVVHFLLSCNIGEVLVLLVAALVGSPLPLLPIHILWTNLVTDGLPAIGLSMEKVESGVMERAPRTSTAGIVTKRLMWVMLLQGAFIAACTLAAYWIDLYWFDSGLTHARTVAFTTLVLSQKFHAFNCRSADQSLFTIGIKSNRMLNIAVVVILASQLLLLYVPALQHIFKLAPLHASAWAVVATASVLPLVAGEITKLWVRRRAQTQARAQ